MLKKFVQQGRSEGRAEAYPLGYVEGLNDARTLLADYFSTLLGGPRPSVDEAQSKTSCCHTCRKHHTHYPTRREAYSPRFTTSKIPTQIRHMGFRPEPFIL